MRELVRTIPNILSLSRIIISPITVLFLLQAFGASFAFFGTSISSYTIALLLCLYAGASDFLDGFIARKYGMKSDTGAKLDERADKIWSYPILSTLVYLGTVPFWFLSVVLFRDSFVFWSRRKLEQCGEKPAVSKLGKWKMASLFLYIAANVLLLEHALYSNVAQTIFSIFVAVLVVASGVHYLLQYFICCQRSSLHF